MLRLPDPEAGPGTVEVAPATLTGIPRVQRTSNGRRLTPIAFSGADAADSTAETAPVGAALPTAPTTPDEPVDGHATGHVRNPLFRAIDGGAGESPPAPDAVANGRRRPVANGRTAAGAIGERRRATRRVRQGQTSGPAPESDSGQGPVAGTASPEGPATRPECYACPVGLAFSTARASGPEALEHLMAASRELVAAARSAIEALETNLDRRSGSRGRASHIPLD